MTDMPKAGDRWLLPEELGHESSSGLAGHYPETLLIIAEVVADDPKGREIRGSITYNPGKPNAFQRVYATDFRTFDKLWRFHGRQVTEAESRSESAEGAPLGSGSSAASKAPPRQTPSSDTGAAPN